MSVFRQLWSRLRPRQHSSWTTFDGPNGTPIMLDPEMAEYSQSRAPQPTQQSLDAMLLRAQGVRVIEGGVSSGQPRGKTVLLEEHDKSALSDLQQLFRIVDGSAGHCMCYGDPTFEFLDHLGHRLAVIGVHHGKSIRWNAWRDDAALVEGVRLLEWLAARNVPKPLNEYRGAQQELLAAQRAWERWCAASPGCLHPFVANQKHLFGAMQFVPSPAATPTAAAPAGNVASTADPLLREKQALEQAYPDRARRAQALLQWFGQGKGPWSGFPAYEQVAEDLLMDIPYDDLLRALRDPSLTAPMLEGAARFLGGWTFSTKRGLERKRLPSDLLHQLLECGTDTTDADKRARAAAAFRRVV